MSLFLNSTALGYKEYSTGNFIGGNALTSFPQMTGTAAANGATISSSGNNQYHVTVPLSNSFGVGPGTFFQIGMKSNGGWTGTMDLGIDNMTVNGSIVPEPASLLLGGIALSSLVLVRRRKV